MSRILPDQRWRMNTYDGDIFHVECVPYTSSFYHEVLVDWGTLSCSECGEQAPICIIESLRNHIQ